MEIFSVFFASLNSKLPYSNKIKFSFGLYIVFILQNVESLFQSGFTNKFDYFNEQHTIVAGHMSSSHSLFKFTDRSINSLFLIHILIL